MSRHDGRKGQALSTLTYYLQQGFEANGASWSFDNDVEIEDLIDCIVAEALHQIEKKKEPKGKGILATARYWWLLFHLNYFRYYNKFWDRLAPPQEYNAPWNREVLDDIPF